MSSISIANARIRECNPYKVSADVCEKIRNEFLSEGFELKYEGAALKFSDQEGYIGHCYIIRKTFDLPISQDAIRTVVVDQEAIDVLTGYQIKQNGNRPKTADRNVLKDFLQEIKGLDDETLQDYIEMKKMATSSNGTKTPFKGVVWKALQEKKAFNWLDASLKAWAGDAPKNDAIGDSSEKAQSHLVDYPVYAIDMLHDLLKNNQSGNKSAILSRMQLLASVSSVGKGKDGFNFYAKKYLVPEKYLSKVDDLYTEGYLLTQRRTVRAVGLITLTRVRSVSQSIYLHKPRDTLRAIMEAANDDDKIIEIHHMLRGDMGVLYQHKVGGNARSVKLQAGRVETWTRGSGN